MTNEFPISDNLRNFGMVYGMLDGLREFAPGHPEDTSHTAVNVYSLFRDSIISQGPTVASKYSPMLNLLTHKLGEITTFLDRMAAA